MRRTSWIFSAPVIAAGLAWSANAVYHQASLVAGQPQSGKIIYFSRNGKPAPARAPGPAPVSIIDDTSPPADDAANATIHADAAEDDTTDQTAPAQRYVRDRTNSTPQPAPKVKTKNYSQLFADPSSLSGLGKADGIAAPQTGEEASHRKAATATGKAEGSAAPQNEPHHPAAPPTAAPKTATRRLPTLAAPTPGPSSSPAAEQRAADEVAQPDALQATEPAAPDPPPAIPDGIPSSKPKSVAVKTAAAAKLMPSHSGRNSSARAKPNASAAGSPSDTNAATQPASASRVTFTGTTRDVTPMIRLRWSQLDEVNVRQECKCGLHVKNTGKQPAKAVVVEAFFPRWVRLVDAVPSPSDSQDHLTWTFEQIDPGEERALEITMVPGRRGELVANATVRFTGAANTVFRVEEPQLGLAINGQRAALVGESLTQVITVSNSGTGVAHDVVVTARIPEELEHAHGNIIAMGIGSLEAGESRELRLPLAAVSGGEGEIVIEAHAAGNLSRNASVTVKIAAPKLEIETTGPGFRYVGRHAVYLSTVTNEGEAAADNVRIVHLIPAGFEFQKANKGGKFDAATRRVSWFIGRVGTGESIQVGCELNSKQPGEYEHFIEVTAEGGTEASSRATSRIESSSKVTMEVSESDDPVEVGAETAYEIRVRNDGTKAAQSVKVVCELPEGVELIDATGPTTHVIEQGQVHFQPLDELEAGATATYVLRVTCNQAGNMRMRAKLTSSASPEPVVVEEFTRFYSD